MPELHRHACGAHWSGTRTAHCGGCHWTFTSLSAFDKHQRSVNYRTVCLDPVEAGLVPHAKSWGTVWGLPDDGHWATKGSWA
jgi:hypothetical protein